MKDGRGSAIGLLLLVVILALTLWHALGYRRHVVDDAWITARYARNLARGDGLVYNPGQVVEGYSNFLLVLAEAAGHRAGFEGVAVAQILGVASLLALQLLFYHELRKAGLGPLFSLVVPVLLGASASMAYWAVAGLETMPYALFLSLAVLLAGKGRRSRSTRPLFFLLLAAVVLCRTEGAAAALLIAAIWAWPRGEEAEKTGLHERFVSAMGALAPLLLILAAYHGFRLAHFGTLSSAPALAKWNGAIHPVVEGGKYLAAFVVESLPAMLVFLWVWAIFRPGPVTLFAWVLVGLQVAVILVLGGDWMPLHRKIVPVLPLLLFDAARGGFEIFVRLRARRRSGRGADGGERHRERRSPAGLRRIGGDGVFLVATAAAVLLMAYRSSWVPVTQSFKLGMGRRIHELFARMGETLSASFPKGTRVVIGDIGYVGYRTDMEIVDLKGLVSPWIASTYHVVPEEGHLRIALDGDAVLEKAPEVVLLAVDRPAGSETDRGFWACDTEMLATAKLHEGWRVVKRFQPGDGGWPHYLMFVRKDLLRGP